MTHHFCTLFDSNFMARGLAMYESLNRCCDDFMLYIFAFDDASYESISNMKLPNVNVISLGEFESDRLLNIKASRTRSEYCWTCTPSTIHYVINKYKVDRCTYLDADIYFFNSPEAIFDEMGDDSILITEHRYTPGYDLTNKSGKYCVQFISFRNDDRGLKVLGWWADACIDWCYDRVEDGKYGDQKYLDDWTNRFEGVHELKYIGGGVAPWNVQQYDVYECNDDLFLRDHKSHSESNVIFYHFHDVRFYKRQKVGLGHYPLSNDVMKLIYQPYFDHLTKIHEKLHNASVAMCAHEQKRINSLFELRKYLAQMALGNIMKYKDVIRI